MKNRNFIKNSILLLLPISMGVGVLFGTSNKHETEVSAYNGVSLPTTIKLNDPSESTIRNYYSNLNSLSENERKGDNLLKNLKTILSNGQKYYNYDSSNLVWDMYEITDRDWELSPASSIKNGTYDASTKTISNYVYEAGKTDESKNPYIRAYYMDRNQTNVVKAWGNHNQDATGINREHLWAKAEGFDGKGAAGARGDPMHLVAANGYANNIHSNYFYGYVDKTKTYEDVSNKYSTLGHNLRGTSKTYPSYTQKVFEPQDCDKGDIARAIFYMAARYNNIAGKSASQETFDADNPNLLLTNDLSKWKSSGYTSTATSPGYHGLITDLLEWNRIDKPDAYEIHRNNLLYTNFTNNRNPFIDFPEWADYIWGDKSTYAKPASDTLNGGGGGTPTVTVTSLEITKKPTKLVYNSGETLDTAGMEVKAHLSNGQTRILSSGDYTVSPSGSLTTENNTVTVTYESKAATFSIGVKAGVTEVEHVTSYTFNSNSWAVSQQNIGTWNGSANGYQHTSGQGVQITKGPDGINVTSSKSFTNVKKVVVKYCTNKSSGVGSIAVASGNSSFTTSGSVSTSGGTTPRDLVFTSTDGITGNIKFTVTCTTNSIYIYGIDVYEYVQGASANVDVTSISLNKTNVTLQTGGSEQLTASISPANANVKIVSWSSSNTSVATVNDGEITAISAGNATITCSALDGSGVTATCTITVSAPAVLQSITLSGEYPTDFYVEDSFSSDGLVVTANYSDNTHVDVTDDVEITGYNKDEVGEQTIRVDWNGVYTTYRVNVIARPSAKVITQSEGYFKVTDSIHVGDKILIVNETGKKQLNGFSGTTTIIGVADSFSTNPKDEYPLTVVKGNSKNTFGFKTSDNKYLYWSSDNTLKKNDSLSDNSSWNISISDGNAIITNAKTPERFLQYNSSNPRFACYLSSSKQQPVQLYRYETKTETKEYIASIGLTKAVMSAQSILDEACGAKNVTKANWTSVKNSITPFLSDTTSDDYNALMFGEAKSSELQGNILEDFLARYDLITDLYGYDQFIKTDDVSRNTGVVRKTSIKIETNPTAIVVMILATTGLISIGGYFFFRRRKED